MPEPQQWPRDWVDADPLFSSKKHTDKVHQFLEALANATSSPPGAIRVIATLKKVIFQINAEAVLPAIPFGLVKVSDTEIRVRRGTVTSGGTFVAPGFSDGDDPPFLLTVSGNGRVFMSVTVDDETGDVTDANDPETAASVPADSDPDFYIELGSFSTTDGILTVQSNDVGALAFVLCGGVTPEWGPV